MDNNSNKNSWVKPIVGGVLVGGAVTLAAPVVVAAAGFTSAGIAAGSLAASMMSFFGGGATAAGGIVATCQTIGAVGAISTGASATWAGAGAVGTWIYGRRGAAPANQLEDASANALENSGPNALENVSEKTVKNAPTKTLKNPPAKALKNSPKKAQIKAVDEPIMKDASTSTDDLFVEESGIESGRSSTLSSRKSTISESAPGPSRANTVSAGTSTDDSNTLEPTAIEPMESVATSFGQMGHRVGNGTRELAMMEACRSSSDRAESITSDKGRREASWRTYRSNARDIATDTDEETEEDHQEPDDQEPDDQFTANKKYSSPWTAE